MGQAAGAVLKGVCGILSHTLETGKQREPPQLIRVRRLDSWEEIS